MVWESIASPRPILGQDRWNLSPPNRPLGFVMSKPSKPPILGSPSGIYTPRMGYIKLNLDLYQREPVWWWKNLWKLNCPAKTRLFMWNVLSNKVSTWEILQKRNNHGPGWCSLCKYEGETTIHIFLECRFIIEVWSEVSRLLDLRCNWIDPSLEQVWQDWWSTRIYRGLRALPLLIIWGVWLARNSLIFKGVSLVPEITTAKSIAILSSLSTPVERVKTRQFQEEDIDKTKPWGFFDGASQNNTCEGGGILFLSDSHYFSLTFGLGMGTNNYAELMSLKLLIAFAIEKDCHSLNVFGDSMNVINWIRGTQRCINTRLATIVEDINFLQTSFDSLTCRHVYRERNKEADRRSKEGVHLALGQWKVTEVHNEHVQEYLHQPFLE
jgi:ribonuclease HI